MGDCVTRLVLWRRLSDRPLDSFGFMKNEGPSFIGAIQTQGFNLFALVSFMYALHLCHQPLQPSVLRYRKLERSGLEAIRMAKPPDKTRFVPCDSWLREGRRRQSVGCAVRTGSSELVFVPQVHQGSGQLHGIGMVQPYAIFLQHLASTRRSRLLLHSGRY